MSVSFSPETLQFYFFLVIWKETWLIIPLSLMLALSDPLAAYDRNGDDIIPVAFQGEWAASDSVCNDEDGIGSLTVRPTSVTAPGFRAKLIKHAGANPIFTSDDRQADSILMLVAQSGEGDVEITHYRLSILDKKLYLEMAEETKKPLNMNVGGYKRCPAKLK